MVSTPWLSLLTWRIDLVMNFEALRPNVASRLVPDDVLPARHRLPPADGGGRGCVLRCSGVPRASSAAPAAGAAEGSRGLGPCERDGIGARRNLDGAAHIHIPGTVASL